MVVVRDGRIVAAGDIRMKLPPGTQVIDATGKWVTPGIVAGFSRLGLADVNLSAEGADDTGNDGPFNAAIDVAPAINPLYPVAVNRADGVTRAIVAPAAGKNIFAGQGAVIDTGADMDPITAAAEVPVRRARAKPVRARVAARAPPRTCCSATRFAKPRS